VLRRRRVLRSRRSVLAGATVLVLLSGGAIAQQGGSVAPGLSTSTIKAAQRALGVDVDGIAGPRTQAATRRFQRENGLTVDGIIGPETLNALGIDSSPDSRLERIADCESGGDPTAVSADGRYRGKYQFTRETWQDMGGEGDPAKAPEAEQDERAARLMEQQGTRPWPACG